MKQSPWLLVVCAAATVCCTGTGKCAPCAADSVGVPPHDYYYNYVEDAFLGQAIGQTFYAPDTLVASVRVYVNQCSPEGIQLFVAATKPDSIHTPITRHVLYAPPGQIPPCLPDRRIEWVFDPPLRLPGVGWYAFFVQAQFCNSEDYYLQANQGGDLYPGGRVWWTNTAPTICYLPDVYYSWADQAMFFWVVFCKDAVTPTVRHTWGGLKLLYR